MGVSRSGYYKWLNRDDSKQESRREEAKEIITKVHNDHPSHGYRWVTAFINYNYSKNYSPGFVYSAFRALGIESLTKHKEKPRKRKERDKYPNLIFSTWETVDRQRQVIVSDMMSLQNK